MRRREPAFVAVAVPADAHTFASPRDNDQRTREDAHAVLTKDQRKKAERLEDDARKAISQERGGRREGRGGMHGRGGWGGEGRWGGHRPTGAGGFGDPPV